MVPKGLKTGASKQPQITNICKNPPSERTHRQDLQKDRLRFREIPKWSRLQSSHHNMAIFTGSLHCEQVCITVTTKPLFATSGHPKPQKESRNLSTHKIIQKQNKTARSVLRAAFWSQIGTTFSWPKRTQNHNNPHNPQTGQQGPPGAHDSELSKSRKINCKLLAFCTLLFSTS